MPDHNVAIRTPVGTRSTRLPNYGHSPCERSELKL